jgi:hypothetical protein
LVDLTLFGPLACIKQDGVGLDCWCCPGVPGRKHEVKVLPRWCLADLALGPAPPGDSNLTCCQSALVG